MRVPAAGSWPGLLVLLVVGVVGAVSVMGFGFVVGMPLEGTDLMEMKMGMGMEADGWWEMIFAGGWHSRLCF
jgi:hypothetical protein